MTPDGIIISLLRFQKERNVFPYERGLTEIEDFPEAPGARIAIERRAFFLPLSTFAMISTQVFIFRVL